MAGRGKPGHPRVIQGEVEQRLLEALEKGAPIRIACQYAGCSTETYYAERERNPAFAEQSTRARTRRAVQSLDAIWKAGGADWRAHAKYLELTFPDDFKQRVELDQREPLKITLTFGERAEPGPAAGG